MKRNMKFVLHSLAVFLLVFSLFGCTKTVQNNADELRFSHWSKSFENGNIVTLDFENDKAKLTLVDSQKNKEVLYGFCEISKNEFVIHDERTHAYFAFGYSVKFDSVDIIYDGCTVTLDKI